MIIFIVLQLILSKLTIGKNMHFTYYLTKYMQLKVVILFAELIVMKGGSDGELIVTRLNLNYILLNR